MDHTVFASCITRKMDRSPYSPPSRTNRHNYARRKKLGKFSHTMQSGQGFKLRQNGAFSLPSLHLSFSTHATQLPKMHLELVTHFPSVMFSCCLIFDSPLPVPYREPNPCTMIFLFYHSPSPNAFNSRFVTSLDRTPRFHLKRKVLCKPLNKK